MKIGIAAPIDLQMLSSLFSPETRLPKAFSFPLISTLALELHKHGHEITAFALSKHVMATQLYVGRNIKVYVSPQRRPRYQMLDFFRRERQALLASILDSDCDVVHAHWTYEFAAAAVNCGRPHIVTAHDVPMEVLRFARDPYWLEKPLLAWPVLRKAACVTAVSPYVAEALKGMVGRNRQVVVVPNGATSDVFELYTQRAARPKGRPFRFASVLNYWTVRKNGPRLLEAFSLLRAEFDIEIELTMFGADHGEGELANQWAKKRGLDRGVVFAGPLPYSDLMTELALHFDALVHPSLEEAHCMAITEAMAMGLPVIGGKNSGGVPWALGQGQAGMLVDVRSAIAIASAMRLMVEDDALRGRLVKAAREKALNEYRIENVVDQYEGLLTSAQNEQRL